VLEPRQTSSLKKKKRGQILNDAAKCGGTGERRLATVFESTMDDFAAAFRFRGVCSAKNQVWEISEAAFLAQRAVFHCGRE